MKKTAEYIGIAIILLSLTGCISAHFNLETKQNQFTNLEIIEVGSDGGTTFDIEDSKLLAEVLSERTFSRKINQQKSNGIYRINVINGMNQIESFQILDEYNIIYKDKVYSTSEAIQLDHIDHLIERQKAKDEGILKEETFKLAHSDVCISIYTSSDKKQEGKLESVVVACHGKSTEYQDFNAYFDKLLWIDNEKKAVLSYYGEGWKNFIVINLETGQLLYDGDIDYHFISQLIHKEDIVLTNYLGIEQAYDVCLSYGDISNDGSKILMNYYVDSIDGGKKDGSFWYEIKSQASNIM